MVIGNTDFILYEDEGVGFISRGHPNVVVAIVAYSMHVTTGSCGQCVARSPQTVEVCGD